MILEKTLDGEIIEHDNSFMNKVSTDNGAHLCWDCANGYPSKCPKIADLEKGTIDVYEFVKKGYQIIENDEVTKFTVLVCENFKILRSKTTEEQLIATEEMRKAMDNLLMYFYDTETLDEALDARALRRARGYTLRKINREKFSGNF